MQAQGGSEIFTSTVGYLGRDLAQVLKLAGDLAQVLKLAGDLAQVLQLAGDLAQVLQLAGDLAQVGALAGEVDRLYTLLALAPPWCGRRDGIRRPFAFPLVTFQLAQ